MSRRFITLLVVTVCWALPALAHAEESYPSRPITLLVPYPAGGFIDVVTRIVAEGLRHELKQQVVVLNRPGGNGKIALGELTRSSPDGYTFLVNNDGGIAVLQALDPEFRFDFRKDYRPVAELTKASYVLTTRPNLPVSDVGQLVAYARANPGKLTFGSPGLGSIPHLSMEMLARNTGTSMIHVPYQGAAPALNDIVKDQIDVLVNSVPGIVGLLGTDKIKILAALSDQRTELLPEVPTLREAGQQSIDLGAWVGMFGPSGLGKSVLDTVSGALRSALSAEQSLGRFKRIGVEPSFKDPDRFLEVYRDDVEKWRGLAKQYGLKVSN